MPGTRKIPKLLRTIFWIILVQFVLLNISAAFYAHRLSHFHEPEEAKVQTAGNVLTKTWKLFTGPRIHKSAENGRPVYEFEEINLEARSKILIKAWYSPVHDTAGTVILFHGVTANKSHLLQQAAEFRYMGYNTLLVDFRAHGESDGGSTYLGMRETEEVKLAMNFVQSTTRGPVFLYGVSMGAVTIARAIAKDSLQPSGIILEMPFGSLHDHLRARGRSLGFPREPFGFLVTLWTGVEKGFNPFKHRTWNYAENIRVPVLMQWGSQDGFVSGYEIRKTFNGLATADKKLVIYENAGHETLLNSDALKWRNEVGGFLKNSQP